MKALPRIPPWSGCLLATTILLSLFLAGCGPESPQPSQEQEPQRVKIVIASVRTWPQEIRVQGSLRADEHSLVGAKVAGRVKNLFVDIGSLVQPQEKLMELEMEDIDLRVQEAEAQLAQACAKLGLTPEEDENRLDSEKVPSVKQEKALLEEAKSKFSRTDSLKALHAVSRDELDVLQAALAVAQARYESAKNTVREERAQVRLKKAQLGLARQVQKDAFVRAPFKGVVEERHVSLGAFVQVGQSVVTVVRIDPVRFHAGVPEREAVRLKEQQEVRIQVEGQPQKFVQPLTRISPVLNTANRALDIEVDVPNPKGRLRAGLFAEAIIVVDPQAQTLALPANAVSDFAGVEKVWVIRNGHAEPRTVRTGRRDGDRWIEILEGLEAGESVALDARKIRPGPVVMDTPDPAKGV